MIRFALGAALALAVGGSAAAEDSGIVIAIKNHQFVPPTVQIPAGAKVKLVVRNEDNTTSEFESSDFHREKVVPAGGQVVVFVGPLGPGSYEFFDDFHRDTRGHLIAK
ncbi:MAG TPA: cupredoxin domain-containing protein [Stellaceae bacterium]|jgi:plastocyanin|nr:cupredoxin domain-containing protein [Stellaceae bacterium]